MSAATANTSGAGLTEAAAAKSSSAKARTLQCHILLVEDNEPSRVALARILRKRGYTLQETASVEEALSLAEQVHFDVMISSLGLEDGDGHSLMATLRDRLGPELRGIALSGYGMSGNVSRSMESGFSVHLLKPVQIDVLEKALHSLLSR